MSDAPERRMIYDDNPEHAPKVVWIQWSALYDSQGAFDHVLEDDFLRPPDLDHMPIRYVREDAAEVEALRKENERLRETLETYACWMMACPPVPDALREALQGKTG